MMNDLITRHLRGESRFTDDISLPGSSLTAVVFTSPVAHGQIRRLDGSVAETMPGIVGILTADHIPGENQVGNIVEDEPLFADEIVEYMGQPLALIVAETPDAARRAQEKIIFEYDELPVIFDAREAYEKNQLITAPRSFNIGDIDSQWEQCDMIVEGQVDSGMQEHVYLETQTAFAVPLDSGKIQIGSSTQNPTAVQKTAAKVLGLPMNRIETDVLRLGGAFGGKEDQATPWAVMCALAAYHYKRPVKLVLERYEDMAWTGKRHSYSSDFKLGLDRNGRMLAWEVHYYQNAGASADLSPAILERTLFHSTNSYYIPNVRAKAASCRTNLPPNTAFRGFGGPQAMFVMEAALDKAAEKLGMEREELQQINLLRKGNILPYGMAVQDDHGRICYERARELYEYDRHLTRIRNFNASNAAFKKGLSLMPVCFGISFTSTFLNQASALIHVYNDGSVGVSTGAIEMGQGVNLKIQKVVSRVFGIDSDRVFLESTNTTRNANTSPTAASSGADMNGNAALIAAREIRARLLNHAASLLNADPGNLDIRSNSVYYGESETELTWEKVVNSAYMQRIDLSSHAFYATPGIEYDRSTEKGNAFAYHVMGTALTEVTLDVLRGTYSIDSVSIVHDSGLSLDEATDRGQVEGALAQGIGWMTLEEIRFSDKGRNLAANLASYKVPDLYSTAKSVNIEFFRDPENSRGPLNSKAIGEPPFMYGIGAWFALREAMKAAVPVLDLEYRAPLTPEKVLLALAHCEKYADSPQSDT